MLWPREYEKWVCAPAAAAQSSSAVTAHARATRGRRVAAGRGASAFRVDSAGTLAARGRRCLRQGHAHAERAADDVVVPGQLQLPHPFGHFAFELLLRQLDVGAERVVEHI